MDVLEVFSVHRPSEDCVLVHRFFDGQPFVIVDDAGVFYFYVGAPRRQVDQARVGSTDVEALEANRDRTRFEAGLIKNFAKRDAGKLACARHPRRWNLIADRVDSEFSVLALERTELFALWSEEEYIEGTLRENLLAF